MWYFYAVSSLLTFFTCVALGIVVYLKNRHSQLNIRFSIVSILIGIWSLFPFVVSVVEDPEKALFYARLTYIAALFTPAAFYHFVFVNLGIHDRKNEKRLITVSYIVSSLFLLVLPSSLLIADVSARLPHAEIAAGPIYPMYIVFFASLCPLSIYNLYKMYTLATGFRKEQIKFLAFGFLVALIGGSMHLLAPYVHAEIFPHDLLLILWCVIISYAIIRYRFLDIRVAVTRAGLFIVVYTVVCGFPFWLGFNYGFTFFVLLSGMLLATLGPLIYNLLEKKAENILLAEQRQYQKILLQASRGMVEEHNLARLLQIIVRIIKRVVKVNFAAAYIYIPETKMFELRAIRETTKHDTIASINEHHPLARLFTQHREPILVEELPAETQRDINIGLDGVLIIPSFVQDKCLGFMILGKKLNNNAYTDDDISVFKTLANEAGLAIENSLFIENAKKTQELLFNAEKLAAIGGMADGLAHQIKNRLYEFSIVSQNMEFDLEDLKKQLAPLIEKDKALGDKLEYLVGCTKTMISNVQRTNAIIQGILNFARTEQYETAFSRFNIRDIIDPAVNLVMMKHQVAQFPISVIVPEDGTIFGVKGQLQECFYNCIDNAYEAIREKIEYHLTAEEAKAFKPLITIKLTHGEQSEIVEISDNGVGIKDTDKPKIFAAFFTTKPSSKSGSGIGNYVGKRIIEEHHLGKMKFVSKFLEGSTFIITLPKKSSSSPAS